MTNVKKIVGAKSYSRKGRKLPGAGLSDSSQRGIKEYFRNPVIGINGLGIGGLDSHGNSHISIKTL